MRCLNAGQDLPFETETGQYAPPGHPDVLERRPSLPGINTKFGHFFKPIFWVQDRRAVTAKVNGIGDAGEIDAVFKKGKKVYEKIKGHYDAVEPGTKATVKHYAKKGYETYKKKRAMSERIEKSRKEWQERSKSK